MSENKQYVGSLFAGTIDISATTPLWNTPSKNVVRSGLVSAANLAALNIIGGLAVVIDASSMTSGQTLLIVASGGVAASVSLSNGGTVAGDANYILQPGDFLSVQFDGTNLVS